jgi:phytoene synthase
MYAARLLYAEIGREVARRKYDSVNQRAVVPWRRKARILADALVAASTRSLSVPLSVPLSAPLSVPAAGALPEAQFLLRGLAFSRSDLPVTPLESARERARWPRIEDRVVWLIDLFERLERSKSNAGHAEG